MQYTDHLFSSAENFCDEHRKESFTLIVSECDEHIKSSGLLTNLSLFLVVLLVEIIRAIVG